MAFNPSTTVGYLHASPSDVQGTCAWIGPYHILTASHCFWQQTGNPQVVTGYTVNPGVNSAPGPYVVTTSHYNQINDSNDIDYDVPNDYAVGYVPQGVTSWFGLNPSFMAGAGNLSEITGYGFPFGQPLATWQEQLTQAGNSYLGSINARGGDSGGPAVSLWTPDGGGPTIQTIAAICCASSNSGAQYCPITAAVAQQIEIWQAMDGWSPVVDRLYRTFLPQAPANEGQGYWSNQLLTIAPVYLDAVTDIVGTFLYDCQVPNISNPTALVTLLYNSMLGNTQSNDLAGGIAYWVDQIENNGMSPQKLSAIFATLPAAQSYSGLWGQQ